jgi:WD40 repeat protein/uncharacterized caspase-like protein
MNGNGGSMVVKVLVGACVVVGLGAAMVGISALRAYRANGPTAPAAASLAKTPMIEHEAAAEPSVWAIVVGIDQYQDQRIPIGHGAAGDAKEIAHWFAETAGWGKRHVLLMNDLGAAAPENDDAAVENLRPSRSNLDWATRIWLGQRAKPGDVVVFSFAGQAISRPPGRDDPPGTPSRELLLPIDARLSAPVETGWALEDTIDALAATGRHTVVCWLDTSLSGRGQRIEKRQEPEPSGAHWLEKLARWPGVTAWLAADGQPSLEAKAVGQHSPFTSGLLKALGSPGRPNNLIACLDQLYRDPAVSGQGFRAVGGLGPELSLWSGRLVKAVEKTPILMLQRGHADVVSAIAVTADGSRLITGGDDSTVKIWRVADRMLLRTLAYHMVGVSSLALSADGRWLASGDGAGSVRLWDLWRQGEVPIVPRHERGIERLGFLPGTARVVSLDQEGAVWLWEIVEPTPEARKLSATATGVAFAPMPGPIALAIAERDGKVRLFGADGRPFQIIDGPGGTITSRRLATDGHRLVVGDDGGRLLLWDDVRRQAFPLPSQGAGIDQLVISSTGQLAVAADHGLSLLSLAGDQPGAFRTLPEVKATVAAVAFSAGGQWLAASTMEGNLFAWSLAQPARPRVVRMVGAEEGEPLTCLAFASDGRWLVAGDQAGGLRSWSLPDGLERPRVPHRRGQIVALGISDNRRYLLQVSRDGAAQVWDLQAGRRLTTIAGRWTSGDLSADGASVVLTDAQSGDVVLFDRATARRRPVVLARPAGAGEACRFGPVVFARDVAQPLIAAGTTQAGPLGPLACVWDAMTGRLLHTAKGHIEPHRITSVELSPDGRRLLTASQDGTARVWDLTQGDGSPPAVAVFQAKIAEDGEPVPLNVARFDPAGPQWIATGGIDGQVLLWELGKDQPLARVGRLPRAVAALVFTPKGRWLAAAGDDKELRLWALNHAPQPGQAIARPARLQPYPHHTERVNALIAWPNGSMIASGGDDTTIKLWRMGDRMLLGTLSAEQDTPDWVAFTPEGQFDSSLEGERQVTWLVRDEVEPLEQYYEILHVFGLTDHLRAAQLPAPPKGKRPKPPPRLSLLEPEQPVTDQRASTVTLVLDGQPGPTHVRIYQNGVPILDDADLGLSEGQTRVAVPVRLRPGVNTFYAMASRRETIDGRSRAVTIQYTGHDIPPRRLHVLALGVSRYSPEARALQFADKDAQRLADFLAQHGLPRQEGTDGERIVLLNDDVTEARVDQAFRTLRDRVRNQPDDTVVVFLAGHTDVLRDRYYLLLPRFPFATAERNPASPLLRAPETETVLPYAAIYRNLARLGALQRLMIVDACQAEAILDDPAVKRIQEVVDDGAHRARTAYLLAARRGEPANEVAALEHGLLTYVLLKGMGDRELKQLPENITVFHDLPTADRDQNGIVSTDELGWYADQTLPLLAAHFPDTIVRTGIAGPRGTIHPKANLGQRPILQGADRAFPLVALPQPTAAAPAVRKETP